MRRTRAGVEKENQALAASSTIVGVPRAKKIGHRRALARCCGRRRMERGLEQCGWVGSGME